MARKRWKPISSYFDLDGITDRVRNREAFQTFVRTFGWTEYMFAPVVYDYGKLLSGQKDFDMVVRTALGFGRLPDRSLERLGHYPRAFRRGSDVVMTILARDVDREVCRKWCDEHQAVCCICRPELAFHNNGQDTLILFMSPSTAARYAEALSLYREELTSDVESE